MSIPQPVPNAWSTGLCDCCAEPGGCGWCLYACCCTCCAYGSNLELLPPAVCCGGSCVGACWAYAGMVYLGFPCILQTMSRSFIRNKYGIPGDVCTDFMVSWCCGYCALCQEHRELVIRGSGPGGVDQAAAAAVASPAQAPYKA